MSETNNKGVKVLASASLLFVTIIWGSAFVVMKNSMDAITPTYLLAYRFTIAALGMAALFWKQIRGMSMQEFKCGALAGLFLFISYYFQTYGLKYTTASKNAFITTLYVVIVPFLAWAVNHVRPKANNLIAAGFAVVGLALLSLKGDLSVNFGDFLTLVCGICFAVHMIFLDRFTAYCTPIRLTVMQMGTAAACSWVLGLLTEGAFHPEVFTLPGVAVSMLYLGLASSMLCFLLQTVGQKYLSASTSSILLSFESVFGLLFSVWLLHEKLTVGVPFKGKYKEIFNSDAEKFGGSGKVNPRMKSSKAEECDGKENSITIQLAPLGISVFNCTPTEPEKKEKPAKAKKTTHSTKSVKEKAETDLQSMMADAAAAFNGKAGGTAAAAAERLAGISDKLAEAKAGLSSKIISLSSIARRQAGLEEGLDKKVGKE